MKPASDGVTLLELMLVLALMAIIAAIAAPRYAASIARYRVDMAARRIVEDLAFAQSTAKATSSARTVIFSVENNKYLMPGLSGLDAVPGDYTVKLSEPPYEAKLTSANLGGDSQITFNGWGAPDSGGTVVLTVGSGQRTVTVDSVSGKATVQ